MRTTRTRRLLALVAASSIALAACGGDDAATDGGGDSSSGTISVSGSSTVLPISDLAAEDFRATNPELTISVDGPGTGDGFELFCDGETEISDASRPIEDEEAQACADNGVEYVELYIGIDGLTVATSPENDAVECLDFPALYALTGPESEGFDSWADANDLAGEVGSSFTDLPDADLSVYGPGEESGTYDTFVEFIIEGPAEERGQEAATRIDYDDSPDDNLIVEGIESSDTSLGWVGYAYFAAEQDRMKAVAIAGDDGECVVPTAATIADGSYPLSRPLFIYVSTTKLADNPALGDFVDFYLENLAELVGEAGYVELPADDLAATTEAWAVARG